MICRPGIAAGVAVHDGGRDPEYRDPDAGMICRGDGTQFAIIGDARRETEEPGPIRRQSIAFRTSDCRDSGSKGAEQPGVVGVAG